MMDDIDKEMLWKCRQIFEVRNDGTWENNLFNFFTKVTPKLTEDLKKPFKLEGIQRIDETPVHKAVREAFVHLIIHADYLSGTLCRGTCGNSGDWRHYLSGKRLSG